MLLCHRRLTALAFTLFIAACGNVNQHKAPPTTAQPETSPAEEISERNPPPPMVSQNQTQAEIKNRQPTVDREDAPKTKDPALSRVQPSNAPKVPDQQKIVSPLEKPEQQEDKHPQQTSNLTSLQGKVQIVDRKNKIYKPSNVIITLRPLSTFTPEPPFTSRPPFTTESPFALENKKVKSHEIDMRNKTYTPVVQTIRKGDSLQFNNHDNIKHNVFSSSGDNTFDLGTFEGGGIRSVALQHTGIVKVYCNIHPEMATFIMVADNPFHAISNKKGEFHIDNVPAGKYELSLWHIRGEFKTEVALEQGDIRVHEFTIDSSNYKRVAHKNKFGKDYEKKPALFEDEFY